MRGADGRLQSVFMVRIRIKVGKLDVNVRHLRNCQDNWGMLYS